MVGTPLYEIDVDDASTIVAAPQAAPAAAAASKTSTVSSSSHDKGRVPSIKFIGKRDRAQHKDTAHAATAPSGGKAVSAPSPAAPVRSATSGPTKVGTGVDFTTLKGLGFYGRPTLTQKEIDAVESGGATL